MRAACDTRASPPPLELYDIEMDPGGLRNRAESPELVAVRDRLLAALQSWRAEADDPTLDELFLAR